MQSRSEYEIILSSIISQQCRGVGPVKNRPATSKFLIRVSRCRCRNTSSVSSSLLNESGTSARCREQEVKVPSMTMDREGVTSELTT